MSRETIQNIEPSGDRLWLDMALLEEKRIEPAKLASAIGVGLSITLLIVSLLWLTNYERTPDAAARSCQAMPDLMLFPGARSRKSFPLIPPRRGGQGHAQSFEDAARHPDRDVSHLGRRSTTSAHPVVHLCE